MAGYGGVGYVRSARQKSLFGPVGIGGIDMAVWMALLGMEPLAGTILILVEIDCVPIDQDKKLHFTCITSKVYSGSCRLNPF
jgi:hypothetical protein